jgi:hypothetical protein
MLKDERKDFLSTTTRPPKPDYPGNSRGMIPALLGGLRRKMGFSKRIPSIVAKSNQERMDRIVSMIIVAGNLSV